MFYIISRCIPIQIQYIKNIVRRRYGKKFSIGAVFVVLEQTATSDIKHNTYLKYRYLMILHEIGLTKVSNISRFKCKTKSRFPTNSATTKRTTNFGNHCNFLKGTSDGPTNFYVKSYTDSTRKSMCPHYLYFVVLSLENSHLRPPITRLLPCVQRKYPNYIKH